jgi:hypothetical protein
MNLWTHLRRWKGTLPYAGGMLDQPEHVMRRLDVIGDLVDEHERDENKLRKQRIDNAAFIQQQQMAGGLRMGQGPRVVFRGKE